MFKVNNTEAASDGAVSADFEAMAKVAFPAITAPKIAPAEDAGGASNPATVADQAGGPVASEPTPIAGEFRVNTYTTGQQMNSSIAALDNGGFVVTWSSVGQDGSDYGIYGQRYTAAGILDGGEFAINSFTNSRQIHSSVAALNGGGFVVTWQSFNQDDGRYGIHGQRFTAAGVADGSEFRVNSLNTGDHEYASVTALTGGGFVVTWSSDRLFSSSHDIYGQRYDAAGAAVGGEFRVNTVTSNDQVDSSVAALDSGGFVVIWASAGQDGSTYGVYGQRYNSAGAADGNEFRVNTYTSNAQISPEVAALIGGGFVVTWTSNFQDGDVAGVYGQRYTATGAADGSEFRVNTVTVSYQDYSSVAALADGGFVVTWFSQDGDGYGVYGQRFTAAGVAEGGEFLVNQTTFGNQLQDFRSLQSVAQLADGSLVATWHGNGIGDSDGIFARQFAVPPSNQAPVVDLNGAATGIDAAASFIENGAGVKLALAVTLSDTDSTNLTGATVTIASGFVAGDILRMSGGLSGTTASGITFSYNTGTGVLTLSGSASVADYQTALATLAFKSNSADPGTARDITVVVNDGAASSVAAHINITVSPINDAPVITVPAAQIGSADTPVVFSAAFANALSISDVDAAAATIRVKLAAEHGTITVQPIAGLTIEENGTHLVILRGTLAAINAALEGLSYQGDPGYSGADTLSITVNDQGNSGSGGTLFDFDSVAITLSPNGSANLIDPLIGEGLLPGAAGEFDFAGLAGSAATSGAEAAFLDFEDWQLGDPGTGSPTTEPEVGDANDFAWHFSMLGWSGSTGSDHML